MAGFFTPRTQAPAWRDSISGSASVSAGSADDLARYAEANAAMKAALEKVVGTKDSFFKGQAKTLANLADDVKAAKIEAGDALNHCLDGLCRCVERTSTADATVTADNALGNEKVEAQQHTGTPQYRMGS